MKADDMPIPCGVLFDWDGVLIDSSKWHEWSWEKLAAESGHSLPADHFERSFGMKNEIIIPELLGWTSDPEEIRRLSLRKEELYREAVATYGVNPLPGADRFLRELEELCIPRAIASSTHRQNIESTLEMLGWKEHCPVIVSAEDVSRGKPDPEVFLCAAEQLGLPPAHCIVFEDAHVGIQAARAGGFPVVALATTHAADGLDGDLVYAGLHEIHAASIIEWLRIGETIIDRSGASAAEFRVQGFRVQEREPGHPA